MCSQDSVHILHAACHRRFSDTFLCFWLDKVVQFK